MSNLQPISAPNASILLAFLKKQTRITIWKLAELDLFVLSFIQNYDLLKYFTINLKNIVNVLYITFTRSLVHVVLGTELLQRPFLRGGQFSLVEQFFYLDTREKFISLLCKVIKLFIFT